MNHGACKQITFDDLVYLFNLTKFQYTLYIRVLVLLSDLSEYSDFK